MSFTSAFFFASFITPKDRPIVILVFLPGMAEIEEMATQLDCNRPQGKIGCVVKKLHSTISVVEQRQIFVETNIQGT